MKDSKTALRLGLLVAAAMALAIAVARLSVKRTLARATVDDIEGQLAALDPATRAAVVARLAADAAQTVHDKHTHA